MSHYDYKGHEIVSEIVRSDVVPARVSVRVWKAGANRLHDVPVYFCKSLDQAMIWVDTQKELLDNIAINQFSPPVKTEKMPRMLPWF